MGVETQTRPGLGRAVQQANAVPIATLKAPQFVSITADADQDLEKDLTLADTTAGNITLSLAAGALWPAYMPFAFQKIAAGNTFTLDCDGSETIEGSGTLALSSLNELAVIYWDPVAGIFRRGAPSIPGTVPTGVAALNASNITGTPLSQWLTALASGASGILQKNAVQDFGVQRLDLIAANADEIRWTPGFGGTIARIRGINWGAAIAVGTADVALTIGGVAVTGGALSWAIADPAGTKYSSACTAANVFAAGNEVKLAVAGGNTAAAFGGITVEYTRS